jgi:hypothetical protein
VADRIKNIMTPQDNTASTPASAIQSEISSQSNNVQFLSSRVNLANNLYIVFLVATLISTILIVRWNGKLSAAKDNLERAKDRKVAGDLGEKDIKIGELSKQAEELEQSNIASQRDLEAEKIKRVEMEKSLAPRQLPLTAKYTDSKGIWHETNFESIRPFAGIQVMIRVLNDAEAERAASGIIELCRMAGLKVIGVERRNDMNTGFFDGVIVEPYDPRVSMPKNASHDELIKLQRDEDISRAAAEAMVEVLVSNAWQARTFPSDKSIPPLTIRVSVGFKPTPYFDRDPQWEKDMTDSSDKKASESRQRDIQEVIGKYHLEIPK